MLKQDALRHDDRPGSRAGVMFCHQGILVDIEVLQALGGIDTQHDEAKYTNTDNGRKLLCIEAFNQELLLVEGMGVLAKDSDKFWYVAQD